LHLLTFFLHVRDSRDTSRVNLLRPELVERS
jgi:hypothetical protein